ncbi:hypothetical protein Acsp07_06490 [Actinomycetospora sp. NBRC 106378]|jgi:hypothetical protein|nr:hypothetical protein Acsp07_06490 [Actinomycetospora sp. NBRC 106378]
MPGPMTEPQDDTVRSLIAQAREEILDEQSESDEKRAQEAAE